MSARTKEWPAYIKFTAKTLRSFTHSLFKLVSKHEIRYDRVQIVR